jgi:DUF2950 family protein
MNMPRLLSRSWLQAAIGRLAFVAVVAFAMVPATSALAQQSFKSPEAAADALVAAIKSGDAKTLESIMGPDAADALSSGDPVADKNDYENFARRYAKMHRFEYDDNGHVIIYIGAENWPMAIPLAKKGDGWIFDLAAGKQELLFRRIGANELNTIGVLENLADAQEEYVSEPRNGSGKPQYAQKVFSDPGKQDGLYWAAAAGQPPSPIGPLIATAAAAGYKHGATPSPYHGYFYKVLKKQGPQAPGGAKDYLVDGAMTKGFAFLAYPAEYKDSGVMTFMINQDDVVVQKDLGPDTKKIAAAMTEYNPDATWDQVIDYSSAGVSDDGS